MRLSATNNETTPLHVPHVEDVINIQLPYDPRPLRSPNYGVDLSTPFRFMALLSILPQTPRTSKTLLISWLSIFKVKRQAAMMSTILLSLMVWEMQFGTSSRQFTCPNGMPYLLIRNWIISGPRSHLNSPRVLLLPMVFPRRIHPSRPPSLSIKPCLFPLF